MDYLFTADVIYNINNMKTNKEMVGVIYKYTCPDNKIYI